jgi:hypothetical protein
MTQVVELCLASRKPLVQTPVQERDRQTDRQTEEPGTSGRPTLQGLLKEPVGDIFCPGPPTSPEVPQVPSMGQLPSLRSPLTGEG